MTTSTRLNKRGVFMKATLINGSARNNGRCVQNDDVQMIVKDILSFDSVVIATPSYWADVPA